MSTRWEYYKRQYKDCDFDVLGSAGWELAAVVADPNHTGYGQYMCLFKRARVDNPEARLAPPEPPKPVGAFDDGLAERLAQAAYGVFFDKLEDPKPWAELSLVTKARWELAVRAILTELAAKPVELPKITGRVVYDAVISHVTGHLPDFENDTDGRQHKWQLAALEIFDTMSARLAPILAAKEAKIAEHLAAEMRTLGRLADVNEILGGDENELAENTAKRAAKRIADLEKRLAELENERWHLEWHDAIGALSEAWPFGEPIEANPTLGDWTRKLVELKNKRIADLEKRLAEQNAPVDATGKTPGTMAKEAFYHAMMNHHESEGVNAWEIAAQAILRAFGQNTSDALQRVRKRVEKMDGMEDVSDRRGADKWVFRENVLEIIDELANITDPQKPTKPADHVHEIGSCTHCDTTQNITDVKKPTKP